MPRRRQLRVHKSPLHRSKRSRRRARLDAGFGAARAFQPLEPRLYLNAAPTANDQYISGLFADLLNRPATAADVRSFSAQLDSGIGSLIPGDLLGSLSSTLGSILGEGAAARVPVALEIMDSAEFDTAAVQNAFSSLLGRQADPAGLAAFAGFLSSGGSLAQLDALIAGSPEYFQTRGKGTTEGFLDALYQDALARAPDAAGLTSFTTALASGYSDQAVANFIFGSSEFQSDWISGLYGHFADRAPTPAELQSSTLLLHVAGEKAALAGILANGSSYGVLSDHANGLYVTEMYRDLLQRDPDTASLNAWENALDSGTTTPTQVANGILSSPEYDGDTVDVIYQQYLGRAADPNGRAFFANMLASGGTPEQVTADIGSSSEFIQYHTDGTAQGFLNAFYQDTFGVPLSTADPGFAASLNLALAPHNLAQFVLAMPQYRAAMTQKLDAQLLGRGPTASEEAAQAAALSAGDDALIESIVTSPGYSAIDATAAVAPGTFTFNLLGQVHALLSDDVVQANTLGTASAGSVDVSSLVATLQSLEQDVSGLQSSIAPILLRKSQSVQIGTLNGQPLTFTTADLTAIDKTVLALVNDPSGAAAPNLQAATQDTTNDGDDDDDDLPSASDLQATNQYTAEQKRHATVAAITELGTLIGDLLPEDKAEIVLATIGAAEIAQGTFQLFEGNKVNPDVVAPEVKDFLSEQIAGKIVTGSEEALGRHKFGPDIKFANDVNEVINDFNLADPNSTLSKLIGNVNVILGNTSTPPPQDLAPNITALQPELAFNAMQGGANAPAQSLQVTNDTSNGSTLNATVATDASGIVNVSSQSTGSVPSGGVDDVDVSINPQGLAPGQYDQGIVIAEPDGEAIFVPVGATVGSFTVLPPQVGAEFGDDQNKTVLPPPPPPPPGGGITYVGDLQANVNGSSIPDNFGNQVQHIVMSITSDGGGVLTGTITVSPYNGTPFSAQFNVPYTQTAAGDVLTDQGTNVPVEFIGATVTSTQFIGQIVLDPSSTAEQMAFDETPAGGTPILTRQ